MWNLTEQNCGRTSGEWRSRRDFLRIGTLGLTGMTLADLLLARAGGAEQSTLTEKTSVILLFLVFWIERLEFRSAPPSRFRIAIRATRPTE